MQLTTHTDYSLRLLIYLGLSRDKAPATVQEIALSYGISANHIAKVAQTLTRLGYVKSLRGRGGGLVLAGDPERISVGEVVRQTENLKLLECFGENSSCPIDPACTLKKVLGRAQEAARHELGSSHAFLPCLSDKVDIEYHPSRGRFGVANT